MRFCGKCGTQIPDDNALFCRSCGTPLKKAENKHPDKVSVPNPIVPEASVTQSNSGNETSGTPKKEEQAVETKQETKIPSPVPSPDNENKGTEQPQPEQATYTQSYSAPPKQENDRGKTCPKCGRELYYGACPFCDDPRNSRADSNEKYQKTEKKFRRYFIDPKEEIVGTLGNRYLEYFLNDGSISRAFAVVSDKRVYFRGTTYEITAGKRKLMKTQKNAVVDLCDVTGTEMIYNGNLGALIFAIIMSVVTLLGLIFMGTRGMFEIGVCFAIGGAVAALISYFIYFKSRVHTVNVNYAGGGIAYDLKWFGGGEVDEFQKKLHLAKDKANEQRYGKHE